ncbi:MAG: ATP synthase F1 subunit delta [Acidobacteria bacterium]|nr:ATP synthase F1 subunit delta [Acidobacteriota bacterium]
MASSAAASRYARALVDSVLARGAALAPRHVIGQLRSFEEALSTASELRHILLSPAVPPARKRAVVGRIGETLGLDRLVRNFLYVVIDHRRIGLLGEIRAAFEALLDERQGVVRAGIVSARDLAEPERQAIEAQLTRLSGKRVRPEYAIDGELIGGVTARIGSTMYDGSVRGRLESLRRKMTAE